jgi:hypothetical protein
MFPAALDQTQNGRLKATIKELIDQSLPTTIGKLQLAGQT